MAHLHTQFTAQYHRINISVSLRSQFFSLHSLSLSLSKCSMFYKEWYFSKHKKRGYIELLFSVFFTNNCIIEPIAVKSRLQKEFLKSIRFRIYWAFIPICSSFRGFSFVTLNKIFSIFDELGHEML